MLRARLDPVALLDRLLPADVVGAHPHSRARARRMLATCLVVSVSFAVAALVHALYGFLGIAAFAALSSVLAAAAVMVLRSTRSLERTSLLLGACIASPIAAAALLTGGGMLLPVVGVLAVPVLVSDGARARAQLGWFVLAAAVLGIGWVAGDRLPHVFDGFELARGRPVFGLGLILLAPLAVLVGSWRAVARRTAGEHEAMARSAQRQAERLEEVQRVAGVGGWEYEPHSGRVWWSAEMLALFGFDPACGAPSDTEALGAFLPEDRSIAEALRDRVVATREPGCFEGCIRRRDGEVRVLRVHMRPSAACGDGGALRLIGTAQDVTEARQLEAELERYRHRLEERVAERTAELEQSRATIRQQERLASLGTLAAGVAHQVNNPTSAILASAQYALAVEGHAGEREAWRRALVTSVAEARRCGRIVRSLLHFARNEPTSRWDDDLCSVVRRATLLVTPYASERGTQIALRAPQERVVVHMSPIEIEQVFVNLLRNAVESRDRGGRIEVRIEADAAGAPGAARVVVRDEGRGIADEARERVFDPFYTSRMGHGGSGLGLSVAHGVVEAHGGRIHLESEPGAGTTVTVELPRVAPRAPAGAAVQGAGARPQEAPRGACAPGAPAGGAGWGG